LTWSDRDAMRNGGFTTRQIFSYRYICISQIS